MALRAVLRILFCIILVFGNPAGLVAFRFWKFAADVAAVAILFGRGRGIRIVMTGVASHFVHFVAVAVRILGGVAGCASNIDSLKKGVVHLVHLRSKKIEGMFDLFFFGQNAVRLQSQKEKDSYKKYFFHQLLLSK